MNQIKLVMYDLNGSPFVVTVNMGATIDYVYIGPKELGTVEGVFQNGEYNWKTATGKYKSWVDAIQAVVSWNM